MLDAPTLDQLGSEFGRHRVGAWGTPSDANPYAAAQFVCRVVHEALGIRVDARYGRLRWEPGADVRATPQQPVRGHGLVMGTVTVDLDWTATEDPSGMVTQLFEVTPVSGGVPIQVLFAPAHGLDRVEAVALNGEAVIPEVDERDGHDVVRLQAPLDQPLRLAVKGWV